MLNIEFFILMKLVKIRGEKFLEDIKSCWSLDSYDLGWCLDSEIWCSEFEFFWNEFFGLNFWIEYVF